MKILIVYYSGVGNTKMVANMIATELSSTYSVDIFSIERITNTTHFEDYDAIVIGYPTIHCSPAKPIVDFFETVQAIPNKLPTYIFTTCGLYSANTNRIFAKQILAKGFITILDNSFRCAATDGVLLVPQINFFQTHQKNLEEVIKSDCGIFVKRLKNDIKLRIPRFKLYSVLNYPNKLGGSKFKHSIYTHHDSCSKCNKCLKRCPVNAISSDGFGFPKIDKESCINCYRCIHHCPTRALSLSKAKRVKITLN